MAWISPDSSIRTGQPKVIVTDETAIPEACVRITRKPNLTVIKGMIEIGVPVPGATLSNAEPTLAMSKT